MKLRWRAAKGTYFVWPRLKTMDLRYGVASSKEFRSEEPFNIPVFRAKNRDFVVLQYQDDDEWVDVKYGEQA